MAAAAAVAVPGAQIDKLYTNRMALDYNHAPMSRHLRSVTKMHHEREKFRLVSVDHVGHVL